MPFCHFFARRRGTGENKKAYNNRQTMLFFSAISVKTYYLCNVYGHNGIQPLCLFM